MNKIDFANKIGYLFSLIPLDKLLHFTAGLMIAAIVAIVWPTVADFALFAVILVALAKEGFDQWLYGGFDWLDFTATVLGGLFIQILVLL